MLHAPITPTATPVMTPAHYLHLCRKASGLAIGAVAGRITPRHSQRSRIAAHIRLLETHGVTAKRRRDIERLAAIFALDVDVYFQLATQPAEHHPHICPGCGWSLNDRRPRCTRRRYSVSCADLREAA